MDPRAGLSRNRRSAITLICFLQARRSLSFNGNVTNLDLGALTSRFEVLSSASKSSNGEFGESQNPRVNDNSLTENLVSGDFGTRHPRSLNNQSMGRAVRILTKRGRARLTLPHSEGAD